MTTSLTWRSGKSWDILFQEDPAGLVGKTFVLKHANGNVGVFSVLDGGEILWFRNDYTHDIPKPSSTQERGAFSLRHIDVEVAEVTDLQYVLSVMEDEILKRLELL